MLKRQRNVEGKNRNKLIFSYRKNIVQGIKEYFKQLTWSLVVTMSYIWQNKIFKILVSQDIDSFLETEY